MKKNKLIVLGGFAGAGKTTIARRLAADFNYPFVSTDELNNALRPILQKDFKETSPAAYDVMWHILKGYLKNGVTCTLDTHMCFERTWKNLDKLKDELPDLDMILIILTCSFESHKARIEKRGREDREHLNLGGDKLEDTMFKYEFITNLDRNDIIRIDADGPIDDVYKKVLEVLNLKQKP